MDMLKILLKVTVWVTVVAVAVHLLVSHLSNQPGIVTEPKSNYDFIIVGAGSSGCVLARRLWEMTNMSVLVIEAGDTTSWLNWIPLMAPALQSQMTANWGYKTVSQKNSQHGIHNRKSLWPKGKALGGTSVLNYMLHVWGARTDFDDVWSGGDPSTGWGYESVKKYFKKSESYSKHTASVNRGKRGPMTVTEFDKSSSPLVTTFLDGVSSLGIRIGDLNGDLEDGAMLSQSNILNGWRVSTFDAYLKPIMEMANIHLLTNTLVEKVIIKDGAATGVQVVSKRSERRFQLSANQEVIVSAGSIGSPQLLMLSGIGPKEHLQDHGIPVAKDLPGVGHSLRDHLNVPLYFHLNSSVSATTTKMSSVSSVWKYFTKGKGYLSHSGVEAVVRLPMTADNKTYSKMMFMLFNLGSVNGPLFRKISNFKEETFQETFPDTKNDSKEGFIILTSCSHPVSKGSVQLSSSNPTDHPLIDPNYLNHYEDKACLINAIKMGAKLGSSKPLRDLGSRLHLPGYRECVGFIQSLESDRYLECWIKMAAMTAYHSVGTCAMGPTDDPMAVLDWKLRVRGVKNLRVVDSSVFPHLTAGNPHATILMVAEKAATFLLHETNRKPKAQHCER